MLYSIVQKNKKYFPLFAENSISDCHYTTAVNKFPFPPLYNFKSSYAQQVSSGTNGRHSRL